MLYVCYKGKSLFLDPNGLELYAKFNQNRPDKYSEKLSRVFYQILKKLHPTEDNFTKRYTKLPSYNGKDDNPEDSIWLLPYKGMDQNPLLEYINSEGICASYVFFIQIIIVMNPSITLEKLRHSIMYRIQDLQLKQFTSLESLQGACKYINGMEQKSRDRVCSH